MLSLSRVEAAQFLLRYQLAASDVPGVFDRLGTIQYDPINPVGRNIDLVLQARVPQYEVDGWLAPVYEQRVAYDAWDKQACVVRIADWPQRALIRERFAPWHDRAILDEEPDAVRGVFREIDERGPLSSLEFENRDRKDVGHSWLGSTVVKRVLRALWARGELVTHHRFAGRHYYDRPERVIPPQYLSQPLLRDPGEYYRWIVLRRHLAVGLLQPSASAEIWSVCGDAATRRAAMARLMDEGALVPVSVGERGRRYHLPASALHLLDASAPLPDRATFIGPLDSILWDRKAVADLFGFTYIWEVYKREPDRRWGYYVLPILYGDRFVARVDSRLDGKMWRIHRWWWEPDSERTPSLSDAIVEAVRRFLRYLRADGVLVPTGLDRQTRSMLLAANRGK